MVPIKCIRDVMRSTSDDWYPCFPDKTVRVRVTRLSTGSWRVSVWGADDDGMEIDVSLQARALDIFETLPRVITKKDLTARGFVRA
jgi:hypothetical protein